jgi:hypothetical protein
LGFRGFCSAAGDRYEPPETAGWLTKQSNEPSNIDDLPVVLRARTERRVSGRRQRDTSAAATARVTRVGPVRPGKQRSANIVARPARRHGPPLRPAIQKPGGVLTCRCSSSNATTRTPASSVLAIPGRASAFAASAARASFWREQESLGLRLADLSSVPFREGGTATPVAETHRCSDQRGGPENRLPGSLAARRAHRRAVSVATITPRSDHHSGEIAAS